MKAPGVTLVEMLVVLAVLAVLLTVTQVLVRPSNTQRAAEAVRSAILWARANAIWRGATVSVVQVGEAFLVSAADPAGSPCGQGSHLLSVSVADHPGVVIAAGLSRGLVWLPDGSGRTCDGGGVISTTLTLSDARRAFNVVVSSLGRVRVEAAP